MCRDACAIEKLHEGIRGFVVGRCYATLFLMLCGVMPRIRPARTPTPTPQSDTEKLEKIIQAKLGHVKAKL